MNLKNYDAYALNQIQKPTTTQSSTDPFCSRSDFPLDAPATIAEKIFRLAILLLALLCLAASRANACGPDFPNNLLDSGDAALLRAPVARFSDELTRMQLATSRFTANLGTNDYDTDTLSAELSDLAAALQGAKVSPREAEKICSAHRAQREKLKQFLTQFDEWAGSGQHVWDENGGHDVPPAGPAPKFSGVGAVPGLPIEFADYLEGAVVWRNPAVEQKTAARAAWERLLARPAAERKYKSTWAAYMLGKYWEDEDAAKAAKHYRQVRELAQSGFADSTGLAAASLGWEARLCFQDKRYREAIELYLEQLAAGDDSAINSLQWVANAVLMESESLTELARHEQAQKVITAHLISGDEFRTPPDETEAPGTNGAVANWLNAVEAAGVSDVDSAEKLALAAYQVGAYDIAQRWIKLAKQSTVALWVQAKLELRAGRLKEAGALLARVAARLPVAPTTNAPVSLAECLSGPFENNHSGAPTAGEQVLAELGVLRLHRGEFTAALDALLRADFWGDAAYVAERVLTTEELKDYVDRNWPLAPDKAKISPGEDGEEVFSVEEAQRENIRYLLGRRLTRELRGGEARAYYPTNWLPQFDVLVEQLITGWNESFPQAERAKALLSAAWITRTNGMELLGTELAPDYHIWDGSFEYGVTKDAREPEAVDGTINFATTNELQRATAHTADPERRFHYRYQAAFMAGRAASMMPDNSDEKALALCQAGTWLKERDAVTADLFYKALVLRCRKTALGAEADRRRWFPPLDAAGNFTPSPPPPIEHIEFTLDEVDGPSELEDENQPGAVPPQLTYRGLSYVIEPGDTLSAIVSALRKNGVLITVPDVLRANPGLEPTRMMVGSSLTIPLEALPIVEPETN